MYTKHAYTPPGGHVGETKKAIGYTRRAIGYTRVSTEEQARDGVSLAAQADLLSRYCAERGLELVEVIEDAAVSGAVPIAKRRGGARVVDALETHRVDALVAAKLDRLFRSSIDCAVMSDRWRSLGVELHILDVHVDTTDPRGEFFLTIMSAVAQLERKLIGERVKAVLMYKRANGEVTGGKTRYGERVAADGVHIEADPDECEVIEQILAMRDAGFTLRAIVDKLNEAAQTARGVAWHLNTVVRIIKREKARVEAARLRGEDDE